MDLLKLLCEFIEALWSFCFELKLLNEPKYFIPWVPLAMFHVMILELMVLFVLHHKLIGLIIFGQNFSLPL